MAMLQLKLPSLTFRKKLASESPIYIYCPCLYAVTTYKTATSISISSLCESHNTCPLHSYLRTPINIGMIQWQLNKYEYTSYECWGYRPL